MKQIFPVLFLILALTACGGGDGGGGSSSGSSILAVTLKYDVTEPYLYGFRIYNDDDNTLLLDSADYSTSFLDSYKTQDQPVTISFSMPLANPAIQKGMDINITAYVNYGENTKYESAHSSPLTIQ